MTSPHILKGVSRSFALSIRLLPGGVRQPVALAYLLARAADTVADTPLVPASERLALLDLLQQTLGNSGETQDELTLAQRLRDFAAHVRQPHENALLVHSQACLQALRALAPADQCAVREVLQAITDGQRWDVLCIDAPGPGVQTPAEVDRYTWQVAGSVGEFWTRLCGLHLKDWALCSQDDLMRWGAAYGQGLQRLNILRDAHQDLGSGRCYFPAEELASCGLDRERLCAAVGANDHATLSRMTPLLQHWNTLTESLLHDGLCYSLALTQRRLRLATALPCLIGIRTLGLLRQAGTASLLAHVKLPRTQVRQILWTLLLSGVSLRQLQRSWEAGRRSHAARPL
jgi:farnesyl-diphosphate farnesyltransferase